VPANNASPIPGDAWWDAVDADEVDGHDLLKDAALFQIVGVPFMASRVIFRDGIQRKGVDYRDDFVSVELRVAPQTVIDATRDRIISRRRSAKIADTEPIADGGESLVINDGSTGLYRQIMQYLAAKELIVLPEGLHEGDKGNTIYDLPRSQWIDGAEAATEGFDIALKCARGLRFSEYPSEYLPEGEMARTWYLA
jgi:hypothetical protein